MRKIKQTVCLASIFLTVSLIVALALGLAACSNSSSLTGVSGEYVVTQSNSSDHPVGSSVNFNNGVATNMWPVGKRSESQYNTMEAQDGFMAMVFEPYAGIENYTYYLKQNGSSIEVWSAISYALRDNDAGSGYSFVIERR